MFVKLKKRLNEVKKFLTRPEVIMIGLGIIGTYVTMTVLQERKDRISGESFDEGCQSNLGITSEDLSGIMFAKKCSTHAYVRYGSDGLTLNNLSSHVVNNFGLDGDRKVMGAVLYTNEK